MKLPSLFTTSAPSVAVQIASRAVSGITLGRHGGARVIAAHAIEPLPAGAVVPALTSQNIVDRPAVVQALSRMLARLGGRTRRVALVLPDTVAKVSLVRIDSVPARASDLDQLIRWHVRKSAPFPVEEAQVSASPGAALQGGGREFVVALARRQVVGEFEAVCAEAGVQAGAVDIATFSLVNAVLAAGREVVGDWLLVHLTPDYGSIVILRGQDLIFFRNRAEGSDESLPDLVHQTAMYYEDRLAGGGFARVVVAGVGADVGTTASATSTLEGMRRQIEAKLGVKTETVDPQRVARFSDRIAADATLAITIAPLLGALAGAGADV
jgi:Tfp pilus assembly PilM family ATPase